MAEVSVKLLGRSLLPILLLILFVAPSSFGALKPETKNTILDQAIDPLSDLLIDKGLDPEEFEAYVGEDKGVYAYSSDLFCMYYEKDAFSVNDPITFGLASVIRDTLSIPRGRVQCMSVTRK